METKRRSLLKALSWRIIASIITGSIVFCFTHKSVLAVGVGLCDSLIKIVAYFFHERIWTNISYGITHQPARRQTQDKPMPAEPAGVSSADR